MRRSHRVSQKTQDRSHRSSLSLAVDFVGTEPVTLMLGVNFFSGGDDFPRAIADFDVGATIFAYNVKDSERYGVGSSTVGARCCRWKRSPLNQRAILRFRKCKFMKARSWRLRVKLSFRCVVNWKLSM